jgi:poly(3-hydroxybutyrate) depolymerase
MTISARARYIAAVMALAGAVAAEAQPAPVELAGYGADGGKTTVSGLSSGAFMAVQLQVAYSGSIAGAGIVAGGPYYCAIGNVFFAGICMGQVAFFPPSPSVMVGYAKAFAAAGAIDPLANLKTRRVYVFSGTNDSVVKQPAVDATVEFFKRVGVSDAHLAYVNDVPAGHAVIAPAVGNGCAANETPYISHCTVDGKAYDQAGAILQHLYGSLQQPAPAPPTGKLVPFKQRSYAAASTGMAETGFVYVPTACAAAGSHCRVHVALHGCVQSVQSVGQRFVAEAGYNRWADGNKLLVLYPQVDKSTAPDNEYGCWDWWGYTGKNYADKSASQMKAIIAMVKRLTKKP